MPSIFRVPPYSRYFCETSGIFRVEISQHKRLVKLLRTTIREVTLPTGGGTTKFMGGSQNFWVPFMGGSQNFGYLLWGDHKINFKDGIKIGICVFNLKKFHGYATFLLMFTQSIHLGCLKLHRIVNTHDA